MQPDDLTYDDTGYLANLTDEQRQQLADQDTKWRRSRLKGDIEEAKRRLETALHLLADATVFLNDDEE
jgi:hypothetical protein